MHRGTLVNGSGSGFCKTGGKPGLSSAAILAGREMQGFVLMVSSQREVKKNKTKPVFNSLLGMLKVVSVFPFSYII